MTVGIKCIQNGILLADGTSTHPPPITVDVNALCYLSFTGTTSTYRWTLSRPDGSHAVISSSTSAGPTFLPDIDGGSYSVTLIDSDGNVYVLDIGTPTSPVINGAGVINTTDSADHSQPLFLMDITSVASARIFGQVLAAGTTPFAYGIDVGITAAASVVTYTGIGNSGLTGLRCNISDDGAGLFSLVVNGDGQTVEWKYSLNWLTVEQ